MKFDFSSLLANFADMPPQKKKVLSIGGIAFVVLLFVSFLLSLTEGDDKNAQTQQPTQQVAQQGHTQGTIQAPQQPNSQIFDYTQGQNQQGGGLESLLNDAPNTNNAQAQQNQINTNDPFANFQQSRPQVQPPQVPADNQQMHPDQQGQGMASGPLPIPTNNAPDQQAPAQKAGATLFCDSFKTNGEAESQKAILAFQGVSAAVVSNNDGTFRLKIGPFDTADKARSLFSDLSNKGLLKRCSLINN